MSLDQLTAGDLAALMAACVLARASPDLDPRTLALLRQAHAKVRHLYGLALAKERRSPLPDDRSAR